MRLSRCIPYKSVRAIYKSCFCAYDSLQRRFLRVSMNVCVWAAFVSVCTVAYPTLSKADNPLGSLTPVSLPPTYAALGNVSKTTTNNPFVSGKQAAYEALFGLSRKKNTIDIQNFIAENVPGATLVRSKMSLKDNQTFSGLLVENGVGKKNLNAIVAALRTLFKPRNLSRQHVISVWSYETAPDQAVAITIETMEQTYIGLYRSEEGATKNAPLWRADFYNLPLKWQVRAVKGEIERSLYRALALQEVPLSIITEMINRYAFILDFQRDIHPGNSFELLYEVRSHTNAANENISLPGRLLYSSLEVLGQKQDIFSYLRSDGKTRYVNFNGEAIRRGLMRTPVDATRISSRYGYRIHPILGYRKAHRGVDFAAPIGARIYAAGDGVVVRRAISKSYGKLLEVRHSNGISTLYAHLSRFSGRSRVGARVRQGEVIGYVGDTGRVTGPHLHYEVRVNGAQVNPGTLRTPPGETLPDWEYIRFRTFSRLVQTAWETLARMPRGGQNISYQAYYFAIASALKIDMNKAGLETSLAVVRNATLASDDDSEKDTFVTNSLISAKAASDITSAFVQNTPSDYEEEMAISGDIFSVEDVLKDIHTQLF